MHARVRIDRRNGLRAGIGCPPEAVEEKVFERFDATFSSWARSAGRPTAPEAWSPLCPGPATVGPGRVRIANPPDGARFSLDPGASSRQALLVRVDVPPGPSLVHITIDGRARMVGAPFSVSIPLVPGEHRIRAEAEGAGADEVGFSVE
jgi:penicillin-binding protein 1C